MAQHVAALVLVQGSWSLFPNMYCFFGHLHCVSKKFPPLNCLYFCVITVFVLKGDVKLQETYQTVYNFCQILTEFQNFCTAAKRMKFATKPIQHIHLTSGMLLHYLGKLEIQIFCRCEGKRKQIAFLIAFNFVFIYKFWYFWCLE